MPTAGTAAGPADICEARRLFPATAGRAYFNTAAVGLASQRLADAYHALVGEWTATGSHRWGGLFVDGTQMVGALPVGRDLRLVDVLAASDHKFLLNAGRGMGYCYLSPAAQRRFTPVNAGGKAGAVPLESFYGPEMRLSATASRFDSSISWLAAIGNETALTVFDEFGPDTIYARNRELTAKLRGALANAGWNAVDLPEPNQSTIVSVPLGGREPARLVGVLSEQGIVCAERDGNLRLSVHFYNHEDDIDRLVMALASSGS